MEVEAVKPWNNRKWILLTIGGVMEEEEGDEKEYYRKVKEKEELKKEKYRTHWKSQKRERKREDLGNISIYWVNCCGDTVRHSCVWYFGLMVVIDYSTTLTFAAAKRRNWMTVCLSGHKLKYPERMYIEWCMKSRQSMT